MSSPIKFTHNLVDTITIIIVQGYDDVGALMCLGTVMYVHNSLGTNVSGNSCVGTILYGHKRGGTDIDICSRPTIVIVIGPLEESKKVRLLYMHKSPAHVRHSSMNQEWSKEEEEKRERGKREEARRERQKPGD